MSAPTARLRLPSPDRRPLILESTAWRADSLSILQRLKALVDNHRGP